MVEGVARIELLHELDDCVIGAWSDVLVAVTRAPLSRHAVETYMSEARQLLEQNSEGIALIFLLASPEPGLEHGAQQVLVKELKELENRLRSGTVVIRNRGLRGTLQRNIVRTVTTARRLELPVKVVPDVSEAVAWYRRHTSKRSGPTGLARALTDFVEQWDPSASAPRK